jgi:hypothetical protein
MHDRYFYAFEVMTIVLACMKPRWALAAIAAQLSGVAAYSVGAGGTFLALRIGIVINVMLLFWLLKIAESANDSPSAETAEGQSPSRVGGPATA